MSTGVLESCDSGTSAIQGRPSCSPRLSPQQYTSPFFVTAQSTSPPQLTDSATSSFTRSGGFSSSLRFELPQHQMEPSPRTAQAWLAAAHSDLMPGPALHVPSSQIHPSLHSSETTLSPSHLSLCVRSTQPHFFSSTP